MTRLCVGSLSQYPSHSNYQTNNESNCDDILRIIKNHFEKLYKFQETSANDVFFPLDSDEYLNEEDVSYLDRPITVSEILLALKKSKRGSAPGLDGLPGEVYSFFLERH